MRRLEVLVEERSMQTFLQEFLPSVLPEEWTCQVRDFQGKHRLLRSVEKVMTGCARMGYCVLVLVDQDSEDCQSLKRRLDTMAEHAGLTLASVACDSPGTAINRIVVRELEAWFLSDPAFIVEHSKVPERFRSQKRYRDPELIGDCWEATRDLLQRHRYPFSKVDLAARMGRRMAERGSHEHNTASSFQHFLSGLARLTSQGEAA